MHAESEIPRSHALGLSACRRRRAGAYDRAQGPCVMRFFFPERGHPKKQRNNEVVQEEKES